MARASVFVYRTVVAALWGIASIGCASSTQPIDQSRAAKNMAASEWQMRQFQQQPRCNPQNEKLVYPQPVEDPLHTGRDLERPAD